MSITEFRLDRIGYVLERRGCEKSKHYSDIQRHLFTPPVRVGRASTWPRHETDALIRAHIAGATNEQLRTLVSQLIGQRAELMPSVAMAQSEGR
jgi:prophage regulatory protein